MRHNARDYIGDGKFSPLFLFTYLILHRPVNGCRHSFPMSNVSRKSQSQILVRPWAWPSQNCAHGHCSLRDASSCCNTSCFQIRVVCQLRSAFRVYFGYLGLTALLCRTMALLGFSKRRSQNRSFSISYFGAAYRPISQ